MKHRWIVEMREYSTEWEEQYSYSHAADAYRTAQEMRSDFPDCMTRVIHNNKQVAEDY